MSQYLPHVVHSFGCGSLPGNRPPNRAALRPAVPGNHRRQEGRDGLAPTKKRPVQSGRRTRLPNWTKEGNATASRWGSQEAPGDHSANFSAALCNHFARNRRNDRRRAAETITDEVSGPIPFRECRESSGAGGQAQGGRLSRFDKGKIEANFSRGLFAVVVEQMPVNLADKNPAVLVSKPCGDGHKVQPRHDAE